MRRLSALCLVCLFFSNSALASSVLKQAQEFYTWLHAHESQFLACKIQKERGSYKLCDGTEVFEKDLGELFKLSPQELVKRLTKRGLHLEILCDSPSAAKTFSSVCVSKSNRKMFKEMSALHGQYLPEEKTILIRSSALKGSLIHEYVHHLQSENKSLLYGKIYKQEKNRLRTELTAEMDRLILEVQALETEGKKEKLAPKLKEFMTLSDLMNKLGPWQDLIDEREIFLLYINYGKDFGVSEDDVALAKKNMGFICKSTKWAGKLPAEQCQTN
jgi:hypothetical protein